MRHGMAAAALTVAFVVMSFVVILAVGRCQHATTEVTPVLEATTPESTGPAESEEEPVADDLPATGGIKLANATRGGE